jgi:hypothetical protein
MITHSRTHNGGSNNKQQKRQHYYCFFHKGTALSSFLLVYQPLVCSLTMTKKKKTKSASQKKKSAPKNKPPKQTWIDKLDFVPIDTMQDAPAASTTKLRIVSWNILAESYLTRRSHRQLPRLYQNTVFQPSSRRALLDQRLQHFASLQVDVLCLQEVDMPLNVLKECGYDCIMTPTSKEGNGAGGRVDACGIYYLKEKWRLVDYELVRFDDLATLGSTSSTIISNLQGLSTSFLRRNVGLVCRLQHVQSKKTLVIANAHVYWNPSYEYVKLCQVHYMVQRAHAFSSSSNKNEGVVFCGDLNSPQHSLVHEYLAHGKVNAKRVAPWYRHSIEAEEDFVVETSGTAPVEDQLAQLGISAKEGTEQDSNDSPTIRYMLDFTLNRFTRWLRILGIDAALETEEEEIERTRENNMYVHCVSVIMRLWYTYCSPASCVLYFLLGTAYSLTGVGTRSERW